MNVTAGNILLDLIDLVPVFVEIFSRSKSRMDAD